MPSNIKIKNLAASAGKPLDGSGNPTSAVSGSDMAATFLTGDINQGVYRHVPDTIGSISGTSARPIGDQYQFYEFDGVVPGIAFTSISTISDNTNSNIGKQITFTFTTTGVTSTTYDVKLYGYDSNQQNESLLTTYTGFTTDVTNESKTFTGTLFPNQINFFKLLLTTTSGPTRFGEDITSIYIYPTDLTITSVVLSPSFTGASIYNYTTGSVGFTVNTSGGTPPYFYNFNGAGYGSADVNTSTFDNSTTTVEDAYTIEVKDSHLPTFDTATNTPTTFRPPIRVAISSLNAISEPYVNYTLGSTITNNVAGLTLTYAWVLDGASPASSTSSSPTIYHTSLGSKTHRVNITQASNSSIRHYNTASTTVQVSPTSNVVVTYTPNTETWAATFDSVINASYGTRTYEYQGRSKDAGGTYTAWGNSVSVSSNSISAQSFAGKTNTAQYVQIRVRVRRTFTTNSFDEVSSWVESNEALVPQKGIINMDNQTNLLTGGNRSFDGSVTIGGVADSGYTTPSITAVTTGGTVTASVTKPSSNIVRVVVNNPCTNINDGTATHVISLKDGNGYNLTKSFTTQYKINSTSINLRAVWGNGNYYTNADNAVYNDLSQYSFTLNSFAYKVGSGSYSTLNSGTLGSYYDHNYTAPTSDQTWTYRIVASGGTYTASDTTETSLTVYGYPGQSYGYSIVGVPSSGTLSQVTSVIARINRSSGNFAKISVNGYSVTRPTGTSVSPPGKTEASISDSATSFDSDAFSLYDSAECGNNVVGDASLQALLKYEIDASRHYFHLIQAPNIRISNEPPSLTSTLVSGITSTYAIRGNNIIHEIAYSSYGPPIGGYYDFEGTFWDNSAYAYLSQNTNPTNFSGITVSNESSPESTAFGYYHIYTDGTFCRKTRNLQFGYVPTGAQVGTDITLYYYAREYRIDEKAIYEGPGLFTYLYDYFFNGGEETLTSTKTYTVRGRRLNPALCSWSISIFVNKGYTDIQLGLGSGTLTGPDGTIDYYNGNLDALTYVFQRYNGTSWVDIAGSTYDPGTFGTTKVRVKFTDTWGEVFASGEQNATTQDLDYTFDLYNENNAPIIYGYIGPSHATAPIMVNPSSVSDYTNLSFSTGTSVTRNNLPPNTIVFASEHDVSGMDTRDTYSNFNGANTLISVTVTAGTTPEYGIFRTFTYTLSGGNTVKATIDYSSSPYSGIGGLSKKSFQMFNSSDTAGNATFFGSPSGASGNFRLMALLRAPSVYGATATYRLHGQKSSSNTDQPTDYYIVLQTIAATNVLTFVSESESCGSTLVVFRAGQIDTATTLIIEESTNNSTWTAVTNGTYTGISANTNYSATITLTTGQTKYYRARLTDGTNTLTTRSTDSGGSTLSTYNPGTPFNASITLSINCAFVSGVFNAGDVYWKIYATNSAGSSESFFLLYEGTNDFSNKSVDGYFVVQWYREVGGCTSTTTTSAVYYGECGIGCNNCI